MRMSKTDMTLVLDLDETCLRTLSVNEDESVALKIIEEMNMISYPDINNRLIRTGLDDPVSTKGMGIRHGCVSITRPHLEEFLIFAFSYFKYVIVWSAGVETYVRKLSQMITRYTSKFDAVLTRNDCVLVDGEYIKPLDKLISMYPQFNLDIRKILIVDDRDVTFQRNYGNGVLIPIYKPSVTISSMRTEDDNLIRFKYWLLTSGIEKEEDVRKVDKSGIFIISPSEYYRLFKSRG